MKTSHNTRGWAPDRTDPDWAERVEREAERITDQTEVRWNKAQRRLLRAQEKLAIAATKATPESRSVARLVEEVEKRRQELLAIERLMTRSPAGSQNRGKVAYRGVGRGGTM